LGKKPFAGLSEGKREERRGEKKKVVVMRKTTARGGERKNLQENQGGFRYKGQRKGKRATGGKRAKTRGLSLRL